MAQRYFIGLMSGTSMDGADGVLVRFEDATAPQVLADVHVPFEPALREALFALQSPGDNEIHRESIAANHLADVYTQCCTALLTRTGLSANEVVAVGVHGQTIRHRPELGYTRQTNQAAKLAEQIGIDVIADFRSRDVAAGGQGAPLVPAFHAMVFGVPGETRVICNIGGISNLSILDGQQASGGFDCGPGNALMDAWIARTLGEAFDQDGQFAARGQVNAALLHILEQEPFLAMSPPKSTGRDLFNVPWLDTQLARFQASLRAKTGLQQQNGGDTAAHISGDSADPTALWPLAAEDVQATLTAFTARAIAADILRYAPDCTSVFVCGGGARNRILMQMLEQALNKKSLQHPPIRQQPAIRIAPTDILGVPSQQVEALAFAWLAMRFVDRAPGNLPAVTGAAGTRILGALYPA